MMSEPPHPPAQGTSRAADSRRASPTILLLAFVGVLLGSALVGLAGGAVWALIAPRALYVVVSRGQAYVVNAETPAFIAGDAWYCVVGVFGGLIIGLLGYLLAVRRYGPVPMAAILAGSVIAGLVARWTGQNWGLARFNADLTTAHQGTLLHAPLVLGGDSSQLLWPAIAFWPLAACLLAGIFVLITALRASGPPTAPAWQAGWPGQPPGAAAPPAWPGNLPISVRQCGVRMPPRCACQSSPPSAARA